MLWLSSIRKCFSPKEMEEDCARLALLAIIDSLFCIASAMAEAGGVTFDPSPDRLALTREPCALEVPSELKVA